MVRSRSPERTNENQLIDRATRELFKATDLIEKLRNLCLQRGVEGIIGFGRMFRRIDKNKNGSLSREEFALGLKETGLIVSNPETAELFKQFDKDKNGQVNYDEFLLAIRPPLNESRLNVINLAFDKMDKTGDGQVTIDDLKLAYNVNYHPAYTNGTLSKDEILKSYLAKFERNGSVDGILTRDEFTDYYAGVSRKMAKKRKCSSVSGTPQPSDLKKVKVDQPITDNNSRRSTRTASKVIVDAIHNGDTVKSVESKGRKRTAAVKSANDKKPKQGDKSTLNDASDADQLLNESADESTHEIDKHEIKKIAKDDTNGMDLSGAESSCDEPKKAKASKTTKSNQINGHSKTINSKDKVTSKKKFQKKKTHSSDEEMNVDRQTDDAVSLKVCSKVSEDIRRSARKSKSRFSLKELVSSSDEEDDHEDDTHKLAASKGKKISKKEMKRKVKEFIGSSDEDDYKPDKSEQSEEEEILEADEEISDDGVESDVSDILPKAPKRSKYFSKSQNKTRKDISKNNSSWNPIRKKKSISKSEKTSSSSDLSKYKAPKSGGCTHNSIGIQSLGNPQADLLKQKIANFRVPDNLAQTVSQAKRCAKQEAEVESAFGNGSCVRKLLSESRITKSYEKYKQVYIEKTKNAEKVSKEEMMNILNTFESDLAGDQKPTTHDSDGDTDDDDFEEVENADVGEDFDNYRPECLKKGVTIEVKSSFKQKNKNDDWIYDAIRQSINRQRREIYMNATKVNVLCYLARLKYLNELTFDDEMQALALSTDFFDNLQTKSITETFVKRFFDKYKATFKFDYSKDRSQLVTSREAIRVCFETKQTHHPTVYNLVFLILFRTFCQQNAIEASSRLCIAFRPIDFKCDDIISKKKAAKKVASKEVEEDCTSEDEKPTKRGGKKSKAGGKSGSKKSKKNESEDEKLDEKEPGDKEKLVLNKKNLIECWIEIYLHEKKEWVLKKKSGKQNEKSLISTSEWYTIEPINSIYTSSPEQFDKKFHVNALYILSFDSEHYLKDLTPKYINNCYLHKFKRLRVEDDWLNATYSAYRSAHPSQMEMDEDEQIKRSHLDRPLPKSLSDYKNHGLYFLERHLLKYEIIWPEDAPVVGKFDGKEKIYLRENVHETHGREYWKKEGRQVKDGEQAVKVTTARPKWDKNLGDWIRDLPLDLYHYSQTIPWQPGKVVDGKVPRNEFGNVDLFKPTMLPIGASYLRLNGLLKIAQKLDIDCVPAVTGFDLKKHMTVPLVDGFVVPSEYEEILTIAWKEEQELQYQKEIDKYYKRVYGNWRRLIKGVLIHLDIKKKYSDSSHPNLLIDKDSTLVENL